MLRSKFHRPWQPRMRDDAILNPFAHTAEPEASLVEHHEYEELDELEAAADRADTDKPQSEPVQAGEAVADSGTAK
ncbi:MAG: hypothetical protein ACHQDD_01345 [Steroidobacterales bacterium]